METPAATPSANRRLYQVAAAGFVVLVALTIAALLTVGRTLEEGRNARDAVARNRDGLEQVLLVFSTLQDAETGQRGYLITGDPEFLEPYLAARNSIYAQLEALDVLLEEPKARELLARLDVTVREQLDWYMQLIELREQAGFEAAAAQVSQQIGKRRMDAMRDMVAEMRSVQEALLRERLAADFASSRRSERLIQGLVLGAVLTVLLIGALLFRDNRRRQRAEQELTRSNGLLNATLSSVSQGISVFDRDLRLIAWSPQFAVLRGLDPDDVQPGMTFAELVGKGAGLVDVSSGELAGTLPVSRQEVFERLAHAKELRRDDGLLLEVNGHLRDDGHYVLTYTDITPLKRSELAFRDQATRLAATLDAVVDAIITINESGSIESWSKGAERLFGYTSEQVIRRNVNILMPEPHTSAHDGYLRRYITTVEKRIMGGRRAVEARHRDGHIVPVDLGISEMWLGEHRLFIGVVRDITERLAVERLKNEFISTVSHELRTPLTSISGALGLLASGVAGEVPARARRLVDIARQNSDRLVRLINDILDLEKAESGGLEFHLEPQPLKAIVAAAVEANRGFGAARNVSILLLEAAADGLVNVDRDRLIQVLTNLLSNAIKFSPDDGTVEVRIDRQPDLFKVSVRDFGPGISSAFRSRIFQKFAQADSSDSRAKGGTGLGLSIAQAITERLGGNIGFDTTPGVGTVFHVALPEWRAATAARTGAHVFPAAAKVLICEDDPDIASILVELLQRASLNAVVVNTAHAARDALATDHFDVALVDLNLPDADGLELIASMRGNPGGQQLPVIVMTARLQAGQRGLLHSLQLADWLPKPIDPQRLMNAIHLAISDGRADRYRILHVEDDGSLAEMLRALLEAEAHVTSARSLAEARDCLKRERYDLVILDLGLNDGSGLDLLPMLRDEGASGPPVVLYSATEASRDVATQVQAALVKSRDSLDQLLATIRQLVAKKDRKTGTKATP